MSPRNKTYDAAWFLDALLGFFAAMARETIFLTSRRLPNARFKPRRTDIEMAVAPLFVLRVNRRMADGARFPTLALSQVLAGSCRLVTETTSPAMPVWREAFAEPIRS